MENKENIGAEKIMIHSDQKDYDVAIKKLLRDKSILKPNRDMIVSYLHDASIGLTARKGRRRDVGIRSRSKQLYVLKVSGRYFKKEFDKITVSEMKRFISDLKTDKIISLQKNKPFAEPTKSQIKKSLIALLRWKLGETSKFFALTEWIDTTFDPKEPDALTEEEVIRLIDECPYGDKKFLITLLYSSGCRIEEFLNIRLGDCKKVFVNENVFYYTITIKKEYSKTLGRDIDLLWKDSSALLDFWMDLMPKHNPNVPLYRARYDSIRVYLKRLGVKVLGKEVTPHLLRHSAATRDASLMTSQQLCIKYGWALSSNMPDVYIKRSGIDRKGLVDKYISERKDKKEDLHFYAKIIEDQSKQIQLLTQELMQITKRLQENKK